MKLIQSNEQLLQFIPNTITSVKGERPLYDKISVHLDLAEDWVRDTFTSDKTFNAIADYTEDNPIRINLQRLIVVEALHRAIPSLDLVVTPNGFAVTQTANLVPASKPRIDRFLSSMLALRDNCIARLLADQLPGASQWLNSTQADYFGATLFPDLSVVNEVEFGNRNLETANFQLSNSNFQATKWERYQALRPKLIDLEASLAEEWLSPELLSALRQRNLARTLTAADRPLVAQVKAQIISVLQGNPISTRRMQDCVNYIRCRPSDFPEWHSSETAKLFSPPKFENKKQNKGYWF